MTDRRREPLFQSGSPAYHRIMARVEEGHEALTERVEAGFDRVLKKMERMERDIAQGEQNHGLLATDFRELKRELGDLRDAASLGADKAVKAVSEAAAPVASMVWHRTLWGRLVIAATGFTSLMVAADNVPDAVRGWDKLWSYLRNEPPAVVRAAEVEK